MTVHIEAWEHPLLSRAYAAFHSPIGTWWEHPAAAVRDDAYRYCALVTRTSSRTFSLAASLLPLEKRRAVQALYAFCRATDDVVDRARTQADAARTLAGWRERLLEPALTYDPVPLAFRDAQVHHGIPQGYATQLIDGIARDLTQTRYASFAELAEYCYGVASTVGLMVMHVIRFRGEDALPYAIRLGVALQMTNILRDVGEDWRLGRCYLPLDELAAFGLTEDAIARGVVDDRWRTFMRFQIARARSLYQEAEPGIALLGAEGRYAVAAAAGLYREILADIEAHDFDVFDRRAHVSGLGKVCRLPGIWWRTATLATPGRGEHPGAAIR
jgi:15-cis-phytoene synthase